MKFLFILSAALAFAFFSFPLRTDLAKSVSDLDFYLVEDPGAVCGFEKSLSPVLGCLIVKEKTVYISKHLGREERKFVIAHEIGHYYLDRVKLEEKIFKRNGKGPDAYACGMFNNSDIEALADLFYDYLYNKEYLEENYKEVKDLYDALLSV